MNYSVLLERFNEKYIVDSDGCWIWEGARIPDGYGQFRFGGEPIGAHIASYKLHCGEVPNGIYVLHSCDVRTCVNPYHLYLGTCQDNMDDKMERGRHVPSPGTSNGQAKLNEDNVREIRQLLAEDIYTLQEIGDRYGVSKHAIYMIKHGKKWGWLQ